jgi:RPA family protein
MYTLNEKQEADNDNKTYLRMHVDDQAGPWLVQLQHALRDAT